MTNDNATLAHDTALPVGFTLEAQHARIDWFCKHFEVERPVLEYEDGDMLLSDALMEWIKREGVSIDWIFCGSASCALAVYRQKYRFSPALEEIGTILGQLDNTEKSIVMAGLKLVADGKAKVDDVFPLVSQQIEEYRAER